MKLAIIFDANERGGGGFYQSIKTIETLIKFKKNNYELQIITTTPEGQKDIENRGFKSICFKRCLTIVVFPDPEGAENTISFPFSI